MALAVLPGAKLSPPADAVSGSSDAVPAGRRVGWETGRIAEKLGAAFGDAVRVLAEAVSAKDAYTRAHSRRVARYAAALASELGVGSRAVREVGFCGLLHDVGKIGIPDTVLCKTGPLCDQEMRRVRRHPVVGERILGPMLRTHPRILAAVRWHHERFDGSGFPDGLRGEEIPLEARIVAVVDAYDAMTSERPYRSALPVRCAVLELRRCSGSQFDPTCVAAFLRLLERIRRTGCQTRRRAARRWRVVARRGARVGGRRRAAGTTERRHSDRSRAGGRATPPEIGSSYRAPAVSERNVRPRAPPPGRRNQYHPSINHGDSHAGHVCVRVHFLRHRLRDRCRGNHHAILSDPRGAPDLDRAAPRTSAARPSVLITYRRARNQSSTRSGGIRSLKVTGPPANVVQSSEDLLDVLAYRIIQQEVTKMTSSIDWAPEAWPMPEVA